MMPKAKSQNLIRLATFEGKGPPAERSTSEKRCRPVLPLRERFCPCKRSVAAQFLIVDVPKLQSTAALDLCSSTYVMTVDLANQDEFVSCTDMAD